MFDLSDTICAICTPPGTGGIAAIRLSGNSSWEIVGKIFYHVIARSETTKQSRTIYDRDCHASLRSARNDIFMHMHALHGYIRDGEKTIDEVIILPYKGPHSYTAEDIIEIFCHGGNQIASTVLDLCLKNGGRLAQAGEFTFRAFINGRIDLTEAEAINEIIHAESTKALHIASNNLTGSLKTKINDFKERIFNLVTTIESSIEFPIDVPPTEKKETVLELEKINNELEELIKSSQEGQLIRDGVKVSIIGAPNVGKSSLLNVLLENERAIVTSSPGTTRDTVEEKTIIDGWTIVLVDTAGIREHKLTSEVEKLGMERSKEALEKSDIALLVFDLTKENDTDTNDIFNLLDGKPRIVIGNKLDLVGAGLCVCPNKGQGEHIGSPLQTSNHCDIQISAKFGTNIDDLKKLIIKKIKSLSRTTNNEQRTTFYLNQRQKELLFQCSSHIKFAVETFNQNAPEDLTCDELKKAISKLDEVSGKNISEEVIKNIFSKFCIGK